MKANSKKSVYGILEDEEINSKIPTSTAPNDHRLFLPIHQPIERHAQRARANPRTPSPACRTPSHAYKWREDGRLGVRPRRTGVLAMHACPARLT
ncbi:hypothetical protein PCASD_24952 [Puccinia coronata f. sp. avenae]|uniref:Uncharacterized protein n=1 Tax=Puccinia coronata f. sp. avenae TaxID=200324 RepID=A0A2N5RY23_9BASI|nr:hypothetical protein PCASD_24952 [Puccinia coronata f. sp. avenae]